MCAKVAEKLPMIKISGAGLEMHDDEEEEHVNESVLTLLIQQNKWMENMTTLKVVQVYRMTNPRNSYVNIIISCSLQDQEDILKRGSIKVAFGTCRVSEYIDLIQCGSCQRYGHFSRNCNNQLCCRRCGLEHLKNDCTTLNIVPNCNNCMIENAAGANYDTKHHVTDDRCSARRNRINALKELLLQKN